jgi:AraC-like DNA-binding protein
MDTGETPPTPAESLLQNVAVQLVVSQRVTLTPERWRLDLQSPFWRMYTTDRSGAWVRHAGGELRLAPRRVYFIPAWVRFETYAARSVTQDYVHFYLSGFPPTLMRRLFDRPISLPMAAPLDALAARWRQGLQRREPGFVEFGWAYAMVHAALADAFATMPPERRELGRRWLAASSDVGPALQCIDRRLASPPSNRELAALCHVSTDHFIRRFRAAVRLTPAQYGLERRVAVAARWLIGSDRGIDEIAADTGFTDRFHFTRAFKARLGLPPAAYRKAHRAG